MYIRKRSTMQAKKVKVDVINTRKKARSLLSMGVRLSVRLSRRSIVSRRTPWLDTFRLFAVQAFSSYVSCGLFADL